MKPLQTLDTYRTPDGQDLVLLTRDDDFFIHIDGEELMSTRATGSEVGLAEVGCRNLPSEAPRVLIGGLGCGFTLRACLDVLPKDAEVVVAELFPVVVQWNDTHLKHLNRAALKDRRTRIVTRDVWDVLADAGERGFDAILLDVDNGPGSVCVEANHRLYDRDGIEHLRRAMAPGGRIAIWASQPDPHFANRVRKRGFAVKTHTIRSDGRGGSRRHVVITAEAAKGSRLRRAPVAEKRLKKGEPRTRKSGSRRR